MDDNLQPQLIEQADILFTEGEKLGSILFEWKKLGQLIKDTKTKLYIAKFKATTNANKHLFYDFIGFKLPL